MRPTLVTLASLVAVATLLAGCAEIGLAPRPVDPAVVREEPGRREPAHVVVQHVLISHDGAGLPGVTRTLAEAERLAHEVLDRARAGESMDDLVRIYGDDRTDGGVISIANFGVPLATADEVARTSLVRAFGDAAFALEVGEVCLVPHDEVLSPFGYHVVRRVR